MISPRLKMIFQHFCFVICLVKKWKFGLKVDFVVLFVFFENFVNFFVIFENFVWIFLRFCEFCLFFLIFMGIFNIFLYFCAIFYKKPVWQNLPDLAHILRRKRITRIWGWTRSSSGMPFQCHGRQILINSQHVSSSHRKRTQSPVKKISDKSRIDCPIIPGIPPLSSQNKRSSQTAHRRPHSKTDWASLCGQAWS